MSLLKSKKNFLFKGYLSGKKNYNCLDFFKLFLPPSLSNRFLLDKSDLAIGFDSGVIGQKLILLPVGLLGGELAHMTSSVRA